MAVTQATTLADFTSGIGTAGAVFQVDNANNRIGIGTTNPQSLLDVDGNADIAGIATITTLYTSSGTYNSGDDTETDAAIVIKEEGAIYTKDATYLRTLIEKKSDTINIGQQNTALIKGIELKPGNSSTNGVKLHFGGTTDNVKFQTTGIGVSVSNGTASTATIAAPANLIIDPAVVGDNTGIVRIKGDLFVDGTTTQINSTTLEISDFIVGIASTATTDLLTDGAGIGIGSDKTLLYEHNGGTNASLKSSENLNVATGKGYQIGETERLSADTLSVGTGATVHSPGSNILTLGTGGSEKLRITSDGNLLVHHDSSDGSGKLQVFTGSQDGIDILGFSNTNTAGGRLTFYRSKSNTVGNFSEVADGDSLGRIDWRGYNDDGTANNLGATIEALVSGDVDSTTDMPSDLVFKTSSDGSSSPSERLRITSAGLVGIGTTNPGERLDVRGKIRIEDNDPSPGLLIRDSDADGDIAIYQYNSGDLQIINNADSRNIIFQTHNGTSVEERLRITPAGNIGINTTSPGNRLAVFDQDGAVLRSSSNQFRVNQTYTTWTNTSYTENPIIMWDYKSGPGDHLFFASGGNTAVGDQMAMLISDGHGFKVGKNGYDGTDSDVDPDNEFFRIKTDGSVGINTDNPLGKLQASGYVVVGPDGTSNQYQGITLINGRDSSANLSTGYIDFRNDLNVPDGHIFVDHNTDGSSVMIFGTTPAGDRDSDRRAETFRISSNGEVGISTFNPQAQLHVRGTIYQTDIEYPTIRPTLDLNFAATKVLDDRITFTRDGVGTYYDELGVIRYASNNVPRFDHDPDTGESLGLLVEEPRTNLVSYSYYQGNGSVQTSGTINNWSLLFTGSGSASLTPGIDAPDGSNNAVRFTNNNTGFSILRLNIDSFTPNGSDTYTLSFWARAISGTGGMSCDLADGAPNGTWTDQLVANKWVRVVKSGVPSNAAKTFVDVISNINNNRVVDFWGVQLEKGKFTSSFIPTSGSTVTRDTDIVGIKGINFTDFYNQTEGTIFTSLVPLSNSVGNQSGTGAVYWSLNANGGFGDGIYLSNATDSTIASLSGYVSSTSQLSGVNSSTISNGVDVKLVHVFKQNDFIGATDGTLTSSDTSGNLPTNVRLVIGNSAWGGTDRLSNGSNSVNARIKKFSYYPKRLPNTQLRGLTQQ